jgi:Flp pilus assembly protein TadD
MARAHLTAQRYDEAIAWARKAVQWNREAPGPRLMLATSLGHAGELEAARAELAECERIQPGFTASADNWHRYKFPDDQEHFLDGLRKAGWKG